MGRRSFEETPRNLLFDVAHSVAREIVDEVESEFISGIRHARIIFLDDLRIVGRLVRKRMQRNFGSTSVRRVLDEAETTVGELENPGGKLKAFHEALKETPLAGWEDLLPRYAARKMAYLAICARAYQIIEELYPKMHIEPRMTRRQVLEGLRERRILH